MNGFSKLIVYGLAAAFIFQIGGCSVPAAPSDLIKPPSAEDKLPGSSFAEEVQGLLPDGARLLKQAKGKAGQDVSFGDVDGDGMDEALIVYEEGARNQRILKAALLKKNNEEWRIVWDTKGVGYGLSYTEIADVNRDGAPEVVLGWSLGDAGTGLDIYGWSEGTLKLKSKGEKTGHPDENGT